MNDDKLRTLGLQSLEYRRVFNDLVLCYKINKCLANAKRPCNCSVLCLHPKSSLCSCQHCILDMTSFGNAELTACTMLATTGWVSLSQYFRWKETLFVLYFSVVSSPIDCSTTLLLEVFTQRNFVADFIRLKLNFIPKNRKKSVFESAFGGLRDNVRTPSIARWKARGRFPICNNWIFFAISYGWAGICRSRRFSKGVGHVRQIFSGGKDNSQQPPPFTSSRLVCCVCWLPRATPGKDQNAECTEAE